MVGSDLVRFAPSTGKGPSHHAGTRERHHERFKRDEMLKWNEEITVYAHYRLTISGEHKDSIMEDLQLLNVMREPLSPDWNPLPSRSVIPIATSSG